MSVTTPSTGQKISDFSAGNVDANSYFIQANSGSTSKVSASQIGQFSNLNLLFSGAGGLDTTAKTIVGAINEVNAKGVGDIKDVKLSSPANGEVLAYDGTSSKWVNSEIEADAVAYDNTSSGLTATDVNAAIDEVNAKDASDIPYSQGVSVADKLDIVNTCKTIYNQTTYQNDIGTARSIGDYDFRDYRVLRINLYVNAISSVNRITVVIVNGNARIGASYYPCVSQGNNGNIRIESTNNNITILASSFGNTICIGDIIGVR